MEGQTLYTIGELAELADVTPRTIRYYTAEGLLPAPDLRGKYALYGDDHLRRLELIRRLKEAFLPLNEIRARLQELSAEEVRALVEREDEMPAAMRVPPPAPEEPGSAADYITRVLSARSQGLKKQVRPGTLAESGADYVVPPPPSQSPARAAPLSPAAPERPPGTVAPPAPVAPAPATSEPPRPPAAAPTRGGAAGVPPASGPGRAKELLRRLISRDAAEAPPESMATQPGPVEGLDTLLDLELSLEERGEPAAERRKERGDQPLARPAEVKSEAASGAAAELAEAAPARYQRHVLAPGVELHVREPTSRSIQDFVARVIKEARERFG